MRKITFLLALVFLSVQTFGVALKVIEQTKITFHNFSSGPYDVSNHVITVGTTQYNTNSLMVIAGSLNTTAGSYVAFELPAAAPVNQGSIALWASGVSFPNPVAALMVDYVQWGATGQAYEAEAISVGKWGASTFVNATLPITRSNNYGSWGASEWASSMDLPEATLDYLVEIGPVPFQDEITMKFEQGHDVNHIMLYNVLGQLIYQQEVMQASIIININSSNFKSGVYLVELQRNGKQSMVKRLVKR